MFFSIVDVVFGEREECCIAKRVSVLPRVGGAGVK
jgi:hypothetical protein